MLGEQGDGAHLGLQPGAGGSRGDTCDGGARQAGAHAHQASTGAEQEGACIVVAGGLHAQQTAGVDLDVVAHRGFDQGLDVDEGEVEATGDQPDGHADGRGLHVHRGFGLHGHRADLVDLADVDVVADAGHGVFGVDVAVIGADAGEVHAQGDHAALQGVGLHRMVLGVGGLDHDRGGAVDAGAIEHLGHLGRVVGEHAHGRTHSHEARLDADGEHLGFASAIGTHVDSTTGTDSTAQARLHAGRQVEDGHRCAGTHDAGGDLARKHLGRDGLVRAHIHTSFAVDRRPTGHLGEHAWSGGIGAEQTEFAGRGGLAAVEFGLHQANTGVGA